MIPKIIHYVWVGDSPKSSLIEKCVASWKEILPDYEIIEWNNKRFEEINNKYAKQAFECKKWAFASDYIRLYALYNYGGFYFDSDLEITNDIERFRTHSFVSGFELYEDNSSPITAFMGAEIGNQIISDLLSQYDAIEFIKKNGDPDLTTNTTRISKYFSENFNLTPPYNPNKKHHLDQRSCIYPYTYFCTPAPGKENYSIHHFNGSWIDGVSRKTLINAKGLKLCAVRKKRSNQRNLPIYPTEKLLTRTPFIFGYAAMILKTTKKQK